jgi:hypothetical protein
MGGWGSGCPESQAGNMMSTQPGCIRDHYFTSVFGTDGVCIGDPDGLDGGGDGLWAACWDDSQDVQNFLPPGGGTSSTLDQDYQNPITKALKEHGGNVTGQLLALRLSVAFSCAGVFDILELIPGGVGCYGDYVIGADCGKGKFDGLTVAEFQAVADQGVGGNLAALTPYGANMGDVNTTADCLNNLYDECSPPIAPTATSTTPQTKPTIRPDATVTQLPTEFAVSGILPNPLNQTTVINYAIPTDGVVNIDVYNVIGRKVTTLVSNLVPAGYHSVTWNGRDDGGNIVAPGVYFCRAQFNDRPEIMKKMVKLE